MTRALRSAQRGAALLMAMLVVVLVSTFAAASLWQQWRTVEVETAERARIQSAWILTGALDWARLLLRARALGGDDVELRDSDGSYVRAGDAGAAVALIGAAPRLPAHSEDDIDVMLLAPPGGADPRIELVSTAPAELAHTTGAVIAISDEAAVEPDIARAAQRLARALGAHLVGSAHAASAGAIGAGAVIATDAALAPALCVAIGTGEIDVAGAASLVRVGASGGKGVDGALTGPIGPCLAELARALEGR